MSDIEPTKSWLERLSNALLPEPQDRQQLLSLLRDAKERNLLNNDALAMIEGAMEVSEMQVRDIMIPRAQMVIIEDHHSLEEILPIIIDSGHSRFPVIAESKDEILGLLLAKDLVQYCIGCSDESFDLNNLIRTVRFIPESKRLDILLKEFRLNRNHMAIVVDEYGNIAGLITIEDVLEQIVGDIADEYDTDTKNLIQQLNKNQFLVSALTPIEDINNHFNTKFSNQEFDTIGGLVMQKIGHMPKRGESTLLDKLHIRILSATDRHIKLLRVSVKKIQLTRGADEK